MKRRSFLHASSLAAAGTILRPSLSFGQSTRAGGPTNIVETTAGRVRGLFFQGVNTFRGIPYGASTAGANRFMPPQKPQPWTGVRDVNAIGLRAPQLANPRVPEWFVFDRSEPQGEDCLVLNVFTPSRRTTAASARSWCGCTAAASWPARRASRSTRARTSCRCATSCSCTSITA